MSATGWDSEMLTRSPMRDEGGWPMCAYVFFDYTTAEYGHEARTLDEFAPYDERERYLGWREHVRALHDGRRWLGVDDLPGGSGLEALIAGMLREALVAEDRTLEPALAQLDWVRPPVRCDLVMALNPHLSADDAERWLQLGLTSDAVLAPDGRWRLPRRVPRWWLVAPDAWADTIHPNRR